MDLKTDIWPRHYHRPAPNCGSRLFGFIKNAQKPRSMNIFQQIFVDNHKDANVHISIDASGSMGGKKWDKSITSAVAIAKAASMVGNLNITISFRSTETQGKKFMPAIFIAYDSKVDKFRKIQLLFKHITLKIQ